MAMRPDVEQEQQRGTGGSEEPELTVSPILSAKLGRDMVLRTDYS